MNSVPLFPDDGLTVGEGVTAAGSSDSTETVNVAVNVPYFTVTV